MVISFQARDRLEPGCSSGSIFGKLYADRLIDRVGWHVSLLLHNGDDLRSLRCEVNVQESLDGELVHVVEKTHKTEPFLYEDDERRAKQKVISDATIAG